MGALKERFEAIVKLATDNPKIIAVSSVAVILLAVLALSGGGTDSQGVATSEDGSFAEDDFGLGDGGELAEGGEEGTTAAGGSGSSGPGGASGPGSGGGGGLPPITDTTVKVGIAYLEDPGAANEAAGFGGIGQLDQRRGWEAMLEEINRAKPGGRSAVPVWYSFTTNDVLSKGAEQIAQEQCARWTQDDPVFVVYAGSSQDTLNRCLTNAGVAQIGGGAGFSYDQTWKDYPYLVEHNASALDRMAEDQINQLEAYGYFDTCGSRDDPSVQPCVDGAPRIALIRYDQPSHKAAAKRLKSTLAKHGRQLCSGCEFEITYSDDDIGEQLDDATEVNSAINNCRLPHSAPGAPDGPCTHMLFLGSIAGVRITLFYVQRAEDQGYRAKLGFNRMDAPWAVRDFYENSGQPQYKNQFVNSIIVSYAPSDFDLQPSGFQDCVKLFEDAGESFEGSEGSNKRGQIPGYCDTAWYHIASFNEAGRSLSVNSWLNGVANTGQVKSAGTFIMRTTSTRRDGAGAVRIGDWDAGGDCDCWKPVTGNIPV